MVTNNAVNVATAASGSILQGQGVGSTPAWLALGTIPGAGPIYTGADLAYYNPLQQMVFIDDFLKANVNPYCPWTFSTANGGDNAYPFTPDSGHPGVVQLTTGTNSGGASM